MRKIRHITSYPAIGSHSQELRPRFAIKYSQGVNEEPGLSASVPRPRCVWTDDEYCLFVNEENGLNVDVGGQGALLMDCDVGRVNVMVRAGRGGGGGG